jgi:16S rRNA (adenine1518-N6/adenine1519-N6)-dimethyltransferase
MTANPRQLLEDYGLDPKKSLGQNFLHDPNALARIVEAAELPPDALVLEIGAGTGALTRVLAEQVGQVITIETDERLQSLLNEQLAGLENVQVYWEDFLKLDLESLVGQQDYYVVANLPYYITSKILRTLLDHPNRPKRMVLTVQREVADRILAREGEMSLLSVSVQFYGIPQMVMRLNPAVFWPRPDVESAVIRVEVSERPRVDVPDNQSFFAVVRAGFSQKRKQIKNSLGTGLQLKGGATTALLEKAGIDPRRRAETLSLEEWGRLSRALQKQA